MDARKKGRYPLTLIVKFSWTGELGRQEVGEGRTRDISSIGVYIFAPRLPPSGALVELEVALPHVPDAVRDIQVYAKGRVVRVDREDLSTARGFAVENEAPSLRERKNQDSPGSDPDRC
jgi:PilZ domain